MQRTETNHYATLGLDRRCTAAQIRAAYRSLARQHHPDLNPDTPAAIDRTQQLNAAHEILSDPERRRAYDRELDTHQQFAAKRRAAANPRQFSRDVNLPLVELLLGTTRELRIHDPANADGAEIYELVIPPNTAPGTRFRLPRGGIFSGGFVELKVKARPDFQFQVRGSDLRCDLKISPRRAVQGGMETVRAVSGAKLRVDIPRGIGNGQVVVIPDEGLPRPRGGRGDLLVRVTYRHEVRITRPSSR